MCSTALAGGASLAEAATPDTAYELVEVHAPRPETGGRWAERHAAAGDLNGDGVNDYFAAVPNQTTLGIGRGGRVYAMSGANRSVIYSIVSPETQSASQFGFWISVLGDVDRDGKDDLAVGTDAQDTTAGGETCTVSTTGCNTDQGKAWVFSGAHGSVLHALNNPDPQPRARFGSRIGRAGDLNGDGASEVIVGASSNDVPANCGTTLPAGCKENQGQAYIFDGATGALVRTLNLPASDQSPLSTCIAFLGCGNFGLSVQSPGDVDGDGVPDQLVNAGNLARRADGTGTCGGGPGCNISQGRMYLFSGQTGNLLAAIDDPIPQAGAFFGFQDAAPLSPGDVNGDGRADVYGNGFDQDGPSGIKQGRAWVFDGRATVQTGRGVILYELNDPTPSKGGQFGWSLDKTDYNRSGPPDLYIGQAPHDVSSRPCEDPPTTTNCGADSSGGTYVLDGRDGSLLKSLELPAAIRQTGGEGEFGSDLGWSLAAVGDLNRDGEPDFVAGAPFHNVGAVGDQGLEAVFLSRVPAVVPPEALGPGPETPPGPATPITPSTPARDAVAPLVTSMDVVPDAFSIGSLLPGLARQSRVGTTVRFRLSEAATVTLTFARARSGRRAGGRCRPPSRVLRTRPRCVRYVAVQPNVVIRGAPAGMNGVRFQGRLARRYALRPGRHQVTLTATDAAGNRSRPNGATFRLLPRARGRGVGSASAR